MKVLIIFAHARNKTSLTRQIKDSFAKGLEDSGHQVDTLDLYDIKFNPVMYEQDEPHRENEVQKYSNQVYQEMERLLQYDALVFAFPLYWFHLPAILKGYIDRVFNYTFAYGLGSHLKHKRVLWLTVAGASAKQLEESGLGKSVEQSFNLGIAGFSGIKKSKVKFFYESNRLDNPNIKDHIPEAYQEALAFEKW